MDCSVNKNVKDKPSFHLHDMPSQAAILIHATQINGNSNVFCYKTMNPVKLKLSKT